MYPFTKYIASARLWKYTLYIGAFRRSDCEWQANIYVC